MHTESIAFCLPSAAKLCYHVLFEFASISKETAIVVKQGDIVHHPHYGIGEVRSFRKRSFSDGGTRFAEIHFHTDELKLMLREDDLEDTIRPPIREQRARRLLDHLKTWQGEVSSSSWKVRANAHQKKLDEGDPKGIAEVYKNLTTQQREGKLSAADRKHMEKSLRFLTEVLAIALDKPLPQAQSKIVEAAES